MKQSRPLCPLCNKALRGRVHKDHIIPIAWGGSFDKSNVQMVHERCNLRKHDRLQRPQIGETDWLPLRLRTNRRQAEYTFRWGQVKAITRRQLHERPLYGPSFTEFCEFVQILESHGINLFRSWWRTKNLRDWRTIEDLLVEKGMGRTLARHLIWLQAKKSSLRDYLPIDNIERSLQSLTIPSLSGHMDRRSLTRGEPFS